MSSPAPIVFFDIAGPDLAAQSAFYSAVFGWEIGPGGQTAAPFVGNPGVSATLRADPAGVMLYFGVEDVTATLAEIQANGGAIDTPRFEVPGVVVLGLFTDPAGNRLGLVEMENGVAKIP